MVNFIYYVEYDEAKGTWDLLLDKNWFVPYYVASFGNREVAQGVCAAIESLREELTDD